ncbi:MAG: anaerobic ribonucleoside-triphosphate reductase [bacterium]|nr:anaerobic ribonucleoside-triphosphate reductase [bacterium]
MLQNKIAKVKKRDGTIADFDQSKITNAIFKAITAKGQGDGNRSRKLSDKVVQILSRRFKKNEIPNVEQIQDIIEEVLVLEGFVETAKAYIIYREQRRRIREAITISEEAVERMDQYLEKLDWEVQENANMSFSLQGLNHYSVSYIVKKYWLNKIYPKEIREANESGDFHLHNLDTLGPYCAGWDLYDLLLKGFGGVSGKVETKPAKHFCSALGQVVNFIFTIQGEVAGAVAFSNFDTLLAPFIRYDNLNYQQVKQALQEFMFNMSVPTRVGFQNPFSNITLDLKPSPTFAKQPVIIGGKLQKETYGEFEEEMKIFNKALYEVMLEGDKNQRVFSFPIPTINITKDFPWDEPAFDGIFEASAKYGTNYFANYINSDMDPSDVRSMCFTADTKVIYKEGKHSRYQRTTVRNLVNSWNSKKDFYLLMNGKWVKITDTFRLKNKSGKILKVTLKNREVIKMTPDHPAMIIEEGKLKQVPAKNLKSGDLIPISKNGYEGGLGDFELGRWLGLYISEGGITKGSTVYFSFNKKEKELQNFVKEVAEKRFAFPVHITKDPRWESCQVWVKSKAAVEWVKKFCLGKTANKKHLLVSLYGMSKDFRLGVLVGIYQGDGYERDVEFHTTNKKLRNDVADLARSVGINYTKRINPNNTKGKENYTSYVLRLCRDSLKDLLPHFKNIRESNSSIYKDFGEFYGIKIKSIQIQNYRASVYDFEVDSKEHLFQLANGVITHNCCRLRLNLTELYNRGGGGLFGSGAKTGSIGVVTVNLPRIGYLSKTKKEFFERLRKMMDLAEESLEIKRKTIENFIEKGLYPYSRFYLSDIKKARGGYYANHFATIGLIGMNESLLNFIGENIASRRGRNFTLEVLDFMRKKLVKYQEETGNIYNLEQTPAESTSYRLALKDKEKYPNIITAGTKKVPYYTNSSQLPVNYTDDIFEALKLQDELTCKYNGGSVLHLFLGERVSDIQTVKNLVKKIFENFELPYITLTPTFSICPSHGYLEGEHFECPKCTIKQPCEVYSRVVGYIRPVNQYNIGKQQEFKERKTFKIRKLELIKT